MSLTKGKRPSLADKLVAQEQTLKAEQEAVQTELGAVKKAKKRAGKEKT